MVSKKPKVWQGLNPEEITEMVEDAKNYESAQDQCFWYLVGRIEARLKDKNM